MKATCSKEILAHSGTKKCGASKADVVGGLASEHTGAFSRTKHGRWRTRNEKLAPLECGRNAVGKPPRSPGEPLRTDLGPASNYCHSMSTPRELPSAYALMEKFCDVLKEWLTLQQLREVERRNDTEPGGICHTHDFCNAHEAMHEAWLRCAYDPMVTGVANTDFPLMNEACDNRWNEAWGLAKILRFRVDEFRFNNGWGDRIARIFRLENENFQFEFLNHPTRQVNWRSLSLGAPSRGYFATRQAAWHSAKRHAVNFAQ